MKHLFIGGYYDGHRLKVAPGIEQIVFEITMPESLGAAHHIIYSRRTINDKGNRVFVFVLDGMHHESIYPAYLKLTKGKNHA